MTVELQSVLWKQLEIYNIFTLKFAKSDELPKLETIGPLQAAESLMRFVSFAVDCADIRYNTV